MKMLLLNKARLLPYLIFVFIAGIAGAAGFLGYQNYLAQYQLILKEALLDSSLQAIDSLRENFRKTKTERDAFEQELIKANIKVEFKTAEVSDLYKAVGRYEKLRTTDEELLKKYSKVYFLNENYVPAKLAQIDPRYAQDPKKGLLVHGDVQPFLQILLNAASKADIDLRVISAYRSFGTQADLKFSYKVIYGAGTANQFSAEQGYSEHQLGTAVDFTTSKLGANFLTFEKTPAYQWLTQNAHKYGFILSYPKDNKYYQFEPWHWRFVGRNLAERLYNENKYFYDFDQREIDQYLVSFFD